VWTTEHDEVLSHLKKTVMEKVTLTYPDMNKRFVIMVDASRHALCLAQEAADGSLRYVSFGGRATRKYESHLSATMLELAALCQAVITYHAKISNGIDFLLFTDHLSLKFLQNLKHGNSKLIRYSLLLQNFSYTIKHTSGSKNTLADGLSRREYPTNPEDDKAEPLLGVR